MPENKSAAVTGAIFDCDGTLLDSMGMWLETEDVLADRAGRRLTRQQQDMLRGFTLPETAVFFHQTMGLGSSPADVEQMILEYAVDFYRTRAKARPGALEFVRALVNAGVRCSVVSSSPHSMLDPGLEANGFSPLLDIVVSTDDVDASKRTPTPFETARAKMVTPRESTWVFEDSAYALQTARDAGFKCIGIWDRDESGTFAELVALSEKTIAAWEELDVSTFLSGGYLK